jgi:hypothetical protein
MSKERSDKIRLYVLLGLSVVLVVALYFRFTHKGGAEDTGEVPEEASPERLAIPEVDLDVLQSNRLLGQAVRAVLRDPVRDIFVPGGTLGTDEKAQSGAGDSVSLASLKLKGVVAGGRSPLALINDQFVRTGDSVDGYRVVRIDKKEVLLDSGIETFRLELKEHD